MSHWDSSYMRHTHRDKLSQDQLKARLHPAWVQWAPPILGIDPSREEVYSGLYLTTPSALPAWMFRFQVCHPRVILQSIACAPTSIGSSGK